MGNIFAGIWSGGRRDQQQAAQGEQQQPTILRLGRLGSSCTQHHMCSNPSVVHGEFVAQELQQLLTCLRLSSQLGETLHHSGVFTNINCCPAP
jgi:hypothetical protein